MAYIAAEALQLMAHGLSGENLKEIFEDVDLQVFSEFIVVEAEESKIYPLQSVSENRREDDVELHPRHWW